MKLVLWLTWPLVALLLLAAHFYRAGLWPLAVVVVLASGLLRVPRRWAARTLQALLLLGAFEWLRTLAAFAAERIGAGQPYLRLTAILVGVALFTGGAALVFRGQRLRTRFGLGKPD
jgi:hypothetical protein